MKAILYPTILSLALLAPWTPTTSAATLPYQGLATDANDKPIADGNYPVVFSLYGNPAGGTSLWTESQALGTHKGLFATSLGAATAIPDSLFRGSPLYLGVAFDGASEGTRSFLASPPWAKAADSSRASRISDSAKVVAGLRDSLVALRAGIRADSIAHATLRAADTAAWKALHRADSALIVSQGRILSMLLSPPAVPWQTGISYGLVSDGRDGQIYRTTRIGGQVWMAQNLNFRDSAGGADTVGVCYNYSVDSCAKYGRLYTWAEAMAGRPSSSASPSAVRGVCPKGWHVPSDSEWTLLQHAADTTDTLGAKMLKSTTGWRNNAALDAYGFRALPGGDFSVNAFYNGRNEGFWWSATEFDASLAWSRTMLSTSSDVFRYDPPPDKSAGLAVRCVQD